jgi:acyl-CoA hydrolase
MEIGFRAETEDLFTGEVQHTVSAYLTYLVLDANGRPKRVPDSHVRIRGRNRA